MAQWTGKEWCFTINAPKNSDEDEAEEYLTLFYERCMAMECEYLACRGEVGDSGNYHLQGFVIFENKRTMKSVKLEFMCPEMHLEKMSAKSSRAAAADYVCHRGKHEDKTKWDKFPLIELGDLTIVKVKYTCPRSEYWLQEHRAACAECMQVWISLDSEFRCNWFD